jgi:putative Holliday junction resolvase
VRVLAVDPGDARIGIAISDPLGLIARPLLVFDHISRRDDAQRVVDLAIEQDATKILVGLPLDEEGRIGPQARKSQRLAAAIETITDLPIITWDESGSTEVALTMQPADKLLDARAAAVFLQDYLNVQNS